MTSPSPLSLTLDAEALRPLVRVIVAEVAAQLDADRAQVGGKLCYSESEAAALLGVGEHVLRDERRRGRIRASQIVGRRIRYTPADLTAYLASRRCGAA